MGVAAVLWGGGVHPQLESSGGSRGGPPHHRPTPAPPSDDAARAEEAARTAELVFVTLSADLSWILQYGDAEARLWQAGAGRPKLKWTFGGRQIDRAELGKEGRVFLLSESVLTIVDPVRNQFATFDDTVAFSDLGSSLVLTGRKILRTVDSATLQQRFAMTTEPSIENPLSRPAMLLLDGRVLMSAVRLCLSARQVLLGIARREQHHVLRTRVSLRDVHTRGGVAARWLDQHSGGHR